MKAQPVQGRQVDAARGEIDLDQRALRSLSGSPDGKCRLASPGVVWMGLKLDGRAADLARKRARTAIGPQAEPAQRGNDLLLVTACMAAHEYLAAVGISDGKARRAVL